MALPSRNATPAEISAQERLSLPSGTKSSTETEGGATTGTQQTSSTSATSGASSTQNMTPAALAALESLIQQLSDHPAISPILAQASLEAKGIKKPTYSGGGITTGTSGTSKNPEYYTDELGRPVTTAAQYAAAQARYQAALESEQASGGIVKGGTAETRAQQEARSTEISRARQIQSDYSKAAAFNDATQLTAGYARKLSETIMPTILRAQEASGASGSATTALLANDAAARVAETAASTGLNAAVQYGQISGQLESTLNELTKENNPALNALIQALGIAKGAISNIQQSQSQSQSGTQQTQGTTGTVKQQNETQTGTPTQPVSSSPVVNSGLIQLPGSYASYQPQAALTDTSPSYLQVSNTTNRTPPAVDEDMWAGYQFPAFDTGQQGGL